MAYEIIITRADGTSGTIEASTLVEALRWVDETRTMDAASTVFAIRDTKRGDVLLDVEGTL